MAFTPKVWHDGDVWNAAAVIDVETRIGNELNVITDTQKAALPGTSGTPGVANKYVTDADSRNTNARTPTAHATNHRPGGSDQLVKSVLVQQPIGEVGGSVQRRAGRDFVLADFTTNMGVNTPIAIYNCAALTDASGNARTLSNRNTATFTATGISGASNQAVFFDGTVSNKALYATEASYPNVFQIKMGSWGAWIKSPKRGTDMFALAKYSAASKGYSVRVIGSTSPNAVVSVSTDGSTDVNLTGTSDVCDDKYHFVVGTYDGTTLRIYVDGVLENATTAASGPIFASVAPFNLGGHTADGSTNPTLPWFGPVDESFVLGDVLTDDQVRLLYCSKVAHSAAWTPTRAYINIYRNRRGSGLITADFPTTPLRLHSFSAGALTDAGSNNQTLTNNNAAVSVAGASGTNANAFNFITGSSQSLSATDTGLPATTTNRSVGCWFKTTLVALGGLVSYGTNGASEVLLHVQTTTGTIAYFDGTTTVAGPFVADGQWHHAVFAYDNTAADGVKMKLYLDGRLVGSAATAHTSTTLAGANAFRIGARENATAFFTGQIDEVFVTSTALTVFDIQTLYNKGAQTLGVSPKDPGSHIEMIDATNVYYTFDTIDPQNYFDIYVA